MKNYAWVLEVRPGYEQEYKKRHDEIWPEMVEMLSEAGLRNYNIFRHGLTLFGYFETDDLQKSIDHIVKKLDIKKLSIETGAGDFFLSARKLFKLCGFERCEPFAHYKIDINSVYLTKHINNN